MFFVHIVVAIILCQLVLFTIFKFLWLLQQSDCKSKVCLIGKTAVVTGGSQGKFVWPWN